MLLRKLRLRDFTSHVDTVLEFVQPVTIITGLNGAGKSSIKDAVKWCITGVARVTDAAGRGFKSLIREGQLDMAVDLWLNAPFSEETLLHLTRTAFIDGKSSFEIEGAGGTKGVLEDVMLTDLTAPGGVRPTMGQLQALLESTHFFDVTTAKQKKMLLDMMGLDFGVQALPALLKWEDAQLGSEKREECERLKPVLNRMLGVALRGDETGPVLLDALYKAFFAERRQQKAQLDALDKQAKAEVSRVIEGKITLDDLPALRVQQKAYRQERETLVAEISALEERGKTREKLEEEIGSLTATAEAGEQKLAEAKAALKGLDPDAVAALERELEAIQAQVDSNKEDIDSTVDARADADATVKQFRAAVSHFEKDPHRCAILPTMKCTLTGRKGGDVESLRRVADEEEQRSREQSANLETLRGDQERLRTLRETHSSKIKNAGGGDTSGIEAMETVTAELGDQIFAKSKDLKAVVFTDPQELARKRKQLIELKGRITKGDLLIEEGVRIETRVNDRGNLAKALEGQGQVVDRLEELVAIFGPKGLVGDLIRDRVGLLTTNASGAVSQLTGGTYGLTLEFDPDFAVCALRRTEGGESGWINLPLDSLSTSERLRFGVALQVAFAETLGLRLVVVDNADILDSAHRGFMSHLLETCVPGGFQFVILSTAGAAESRVVPGVARYHLTRGAGLKEESAVE